jgi:murein DD-endopeptidase MepM/ murein hydrolase activator NlpD
MFQALSDLTAAGVRTRAPKRRLDADYKELSTSREAQQRTRAEQQALREGLVNSLSQLNDLRRKQQDASGQLAVKIDQTRQALRKLDQQSADLAQKIEARLRQQQEAIIAAAMQAVWDQVMLWVQANQVGSIPLSSGHSKQFRFVWPEPTAQISQGFGPTDFWMEPAYGGFPHFHMGIDLVEPDGSMVLAADDGVVALVGNGTTGYGNYVVLAHGGGLLTLYGHLSVAGVKVGQQVVQSQPIGLQGSTGNSTGSHLHFEVRMNSTVLNPEAFLPPAPPSPFKS